MKKQEEKDVPVQGAEVVKAQKKEQKKSVSYALKAINKHLDTMIGANLLSEEDGEKIQEMVKTATEKYIKEQYGIG